MRRAFLLCTAALLLCPSAGWAQTFFYTQYRVAQGLPANEVRAVTRDPLGFLWIATDNGLARHDGRSFKNYQAKLESRYVKALRRRPNGDLLLANDADVFAVTPRTDTATVQRLVGARPRPTDSTVVYPNGVYWDSAGQVWISQPNGAVVRWADGHLRTFAFGDDHATGASDSDFSFAEDAQGQLWLAARTGQLYRYAREADRFERIQLPRSPDRVHDLRIRDDTLWVVGDRLVRALDYREIDIAINPLYVSSIRLNMFEVSQPFFISSVGVATTTIARSQFQVLLQNFFSVDFLKIVLLLFGVLLAFGTLLWIVERGENRYQFRPGLPGLLDGLWWAAVTMTTVGYGDKAPKTQAGRTIAIVWMFSAVIIVSGFTATIASTLTVNSLAAEIKQLEDLRTVERIGTVNATSSEDFLVSHDLLPTHEYETPRAALQALARQEVDVTVYDRTVMRYPINREELDGSVELLPVTFNKQYRSFLMPRGSTLRRRLDPLLVQRINQADWREVLRTYNLEATD